MTIQGWSVDLKIAQIELQWGGCRSIREILMLSSLSIAAVIIKVLSTANYWVDSILNLRHDLSRRQLTAAASPFDHPAPLPLPWPGHPFDRC